MIFLFIFMVVPASKYSLLKITIDAGKFHQIRSQLSLAGIPVLGDVKYGVKEFLPDKNIALCATDISFYPATSNQKITLSIDIPKEWKTYLSTSAT